MARLNMLGRRLCKAIGVGVASTRDGGRRRSELLLAALE